MQTQELLDALHEHDKIAQLLVDLKIVIEMQKQLNNPTSSDANEQKDRVETELPVMLKQVQVMSGDPAINKLSKYYMTIGSFFKEYEKLTSQTMMNKGTVNDFGDIVNTGIYSGTDLTYSPIVGQVMVMASKDDLGNFGYFLMGSDMKLHVGARPIGTTRVNWNRVADAAKDLGFDTTGTNLKSTKEIELESKQVVSSDPAIAGKDNRLMSIASVLKALGDMKTAMTTSLERFSLVGNNPTIHMKVNDAGTSGQMQVVYKARAVASMEWLVASGSFVFSLFDKDTGTNKSSFELKTDGKAYLGGKELATKDDLLPAAPTADGDYKLHIASGVATWVTI